MLSKTLAAGTWLCIFIVAFASQPVWLQKPPKHKMPAELKAATCCKEVKELKAQVANLSSTLSKLSKKQESDWVSVVMQVMELESSSKRLESRLTDAESKFSEMNSQIDIMQLQAAQTVTQTSAGKEVTHTPPLSTAVLPDNLLIRTIPGGSFGIYFPLRKGLWSSCFGF